MNVELLGIIHPTVGKRMWQSSALTSPMTSLNRDVVPLGDDIEPIGESRADVGMGIEEDEEPLEFKIPNESQESNEQR